MKPGAKHHLKAAALPISAASLEVVEVIALQRLSVSHTFRKFRQADAHVAKAGEERTNALHPARSSGQYSGVVMSQVFLSSSGEAEAPRAKTMRAVTVVEKRMVNLVWFRGGRSESSIAIKSQGCR